MHQVNLRLDLGSRAPLVALPKYFDAGYSQMRLSPGTMSRHQTKKTRGPSRFHHMPPSKWVLQPFMQCKRYHIAEPKRLIRCITAPPVVSNNTTQNETKCPTNQCREENDFCILMTHRKISAGMHLWTLLEEKWARGACLQLLVPREVVDRVGAGRMYR